MIDDSTNGETAFDVINALVNDVIDSAIEQSCKVTISFYFILNIIDYASYSAIIGNTFNWVYYINFVY